MCVSVRTRFPGVRRAILIALSFGVVRWNILLCFTVRQRYNTGRLVYATLKLSFITTRGWVRIDGIRGRCVTGDPVSRVIAVRLRKSLLARSSCCSSVITYSVQRIQQRVESIHSGHLLGLINLVVRLICVSCVLYLIQR